MCPSIAPHWAAGPRGPGRWAHQAGWVLCLGVQPPGSLSGWRRHLAGWLAAPPCPPLPVEKGLIQPCPTSIPALGAPVCRQHHEDSRVQENQCWEVMGVCGAYNYCGGPWGCPDKASLRCLGHKISYACAVHPSVSFMPGLSPTSSIHLSTNPLIHVVPLLSLILSICLFPPLPLLSITVPLFLACLSSIHPFPHPSNHFFSVLLSTPSRPPLTTPSLLLYPPSSYLPRGPHRCWPEKGWG